MAGLREAMTNLRRLIAAADKHSYTMLVGKPNPTKLANFPEVRIRHAHVHLQRRAGRVNA